MEKGSLADELTEIMALADKYNFNLEDRLILMDRLLLLGEASAFLEDLGLIEELKKKHEKACLKAIKVMSDFR